MATALRRKDDKKLGVISAHIEAIKELQVRRLAEHAGISASEYVAKLIDKDLEEKSTLAIVLADIFPVDGSMRTDSSQ